MISRRYETIVGIFVVASLATLLVMVVIIAQQERLWVKHMEYRAIFKNVSGLKPGSEVRLAGVLVGNVKDVQIDLQGNIVVTFEVVDKYASQIRQNSRVTIGYQGLLGDKSLDLTVGSSDKSPIPPQGIVASVEPMEFTEIFAKAQPSLDHLQKVLENLAGITRDLADPKSDVGQFFEELHGIARKINQGKGSLGLLVTDPKLYQEVTQSWAGLKKIVANLQENTGLMGALMNDPALKAQAQKTLGDLQVAVASLKQTLENIREGAIRFPEIAKKAELFLNTLNKAGKTLPDLVVSGQEMATDVEKAAEAAQKSWLLRRNVPKPKEQTIRVQ